MSPPAAPLPEPPAPPADLRGLAWVLIYFAAFVPIICRPDFRFSPDLVWMFPFYLGAVTAPFCNLFHYGTWPATFAFILGVCVLPYVVFALDFCCLVRARTRRRSSFLLLILVFLVLVTQLILGSMQRSFSV